MHSKSQLLSRLGIAMLAIIETIQVVKGGISFNEPYSLLLLIFLIVACALIIGTWLYDYISKPIKVVDCQVYSELNEHTKEIEIFISMTFISNTATSLTKIVWLNIRKPLQKELKPLLIFPIGFTLGRQIIDDHIFLSEGKATSCKDEKKFHVPITNETKPLIYELCNILNKDLDYFISYGTLDKSYTYHPSIKQRRKHTRSISHDL